MTAGAQGYEMSEWTVSAVEQQINTHTHTHTYDMRTFTVICNRPRGLRPAAVSGWTVKYFCFLRNGLVCARALAHNLTQTHRSSMLNALRNASLETSKNKLSYVLASSENTHPPCCIEAANRSLLAARRSLC